MIDVYSVLSFKKSIMAYSINEIAFTEFFQYLQDVYSRHPTENLRHHISNIKEEEEFSLQNTLYIMPRPWHVGQQNA